MKDKTVRVKLSQIHKVCRACGRVHDSTRIREYKNARYMGPCGDSFCYHSCENTGVCFPEKAQVCDECAEQRKEPVDAA